MQIMQFSKRELKIIYDALAYKCNNDNLQELEKNDYEDVYVRIKAGICLEDSVNKKLKNEYITYYNNVAKHGDILKALVKNGVEWLLWYDKKQKQDVLIPPINYKNFNDDSEKKIYDIHHIAHIIGNIKIYDNVHKHMILLKNYDISSNNI